MKLIDHYEENHGHIPTLHHLPMAKNTYPIGLDEQIIPACQDAYLKLPKIFGSALPRLHGKRICTNGGEKFVPKQSCIDENWHMWGLFVCLFLCVYVCVKIILFVDLLFFRKEIDNRGTGFGCRR